MPRRSRAAGVALLRAWVPLRGEEEEGEEEEEEEEEATAAVRHAFLRSCGKSSTWGRYRVRHESREKWRDK